MTNSLFSTYCSNFFETDLVNAGIVIHMYDRCICRISHIKKLYNVYMYMHLIKLFDLPNICYGIQGNLPSDRTGLVISIEHQIVTSVQLTSFSEVKSLLAVTLNSQRESEE